MFVTANILQPLIDVFDAVIRFFHDSIGFGWGLSIIALTVCVRAVLIPLTFKQFHSMQNMQKLAPQLKELQNKYKDDKARQQQEMMQLYKDNNVSPFASCLPLAAQFPVFISLFYMLRKDLKADICGKAFKAYQAQGHPHATLTGTACDKVAHHSAKFLFIPDLTSKATGAVFVVLIVLYVGSQLVSSVLMTSSTMEKTQRYMMIALPFVFVLFIARFPAGLLVYWITTNIWTIGQQYLIKRRLGPVGPPATGGGGADNGKPASPLARVTQRAKEPAAVAAGPARTVPRPPPRKKKKRSGRRR